MTRILSDDFILPLGEAILDDILVETAEDSAVTISLEGYVDPPEDVFTLTGIEVRSGTGLFQIGGTVFVRSSQSAILATGGSFDYAVSGLVRLEESPGGVAVHFPLTEADLHVSGTLLATTETGPVTAFRAEEGFEIRNTGRIEARADRDAVALELADAPDTPDETPAEEPRYTVVNEGTILAELTTTPFDPSYATAIRIRYDEGLIGGAHIVNTGEIVADVAIEAVSGVIDDRLGPVVIDNQGLISGAVRFGMANESLVNAGLIDGSVSFGPGDDTLESFPGTVTGAVFGGAGDDTLNLDAQGNVAFGEAGDDILIGHTGVDVLSGGDGDDVLDGAAGYNRLHGGDGDDILHANSDPYEDLFGGEGSDIFTGTLPEFNFDKIGDFDADDVIRIMNAVLTAEDIEVIRGDGETVLSIDSGAAEIYLANSGVKKISVTQGDGYTELSFGKAKAVKGGWLAGDDEADVLRGHKADDRLDGLGGDDVLLGHKGDDEVTGHGGDDFLSGAKGHDRLDGGDGADVLDGHKGDDVLLGGAGADSLSAGKGNDTLYGHEGDDVLAAAKGDDYLNGGMGDDRLQGGKGADRFVYTGGKDRILDYEAGTDTVEIRGFGLSFTQMLLKTSLSADGHTTIALTGTDSLVLENTLNTALQEGDFVFS